MAVILKAVVSKPINPNVFVREFRSVADETERELQKMFDQTTETWEHRVAWIRRNKVSGAVMEVIVGTNDEIYKYVSAGTRPHLIPSVPKTRGSLRFRTGYTAKTRPGVLRSGPGGARGDYAYAKQVRHPGTDARRFAENVAKEFERPFKRLIDEAMRRAARKAQ